MELESENRLASGKSMQVVRGLPGTGLHYFDRVTHTCHFCGKSKKDALNGEWNCKPVMKPAFTNCVMSYAMNSAVERQRSQ